MILGVDLGDSRTGYATSDELNLFASTLETLNEKIVRRNQVETLLPQKEADWNQASANLSSQKEQTRL